MSRFYDDFQQLIRFQKDRIHGSTQMSSHTVSDCDVFWSFQLITPRFQGHDANFNAIFINAVSQKNFVEELLIFAIQTTLFWSKTTTRTIKTSDEHK